MTKTPNCFVCGMMMYVLENRRKKLGYFCPRCDFSVIKEPTSNLKKLRDKTNKKFNLRSFTGSKPKFGLRRSVTRCGECLQSKYVVCVKVKQTKKRKKEGLSESWKCKCSKCDYSWSQNHPKIMMVRDYGD